jgi:hypothetical protein
VIEGDPHTASNYKPFSFRDARELQSICQAAEFCDTNWTPGVDRSPKSNHKRLGGADENRSSSAADVFGLGNL